MRSKNKYETSSENYLGVYFVPKLQEKRMIDEVYLAIFKNLISFALHFLNPFGLERKHLFLIRM